MPTRLPIPAGQLIPHRLPMRLVEELVSLDGDSGVVSARIRRENLFLQQDGTLSAPAMVELLAQAYAAVQGYSDSLAGKPVRQGFLVGVRKIAILNTAKSGDELQVHVRPMARLEGFAIVEGEVRRGGELLAQGNLKLWIPEREKIEG